MDGLQELGNSRPKFKAIDRPMSEVNSVKHIESRDHYFRYIERSLGHSLSSFISVNSTGIMTNETLNNSLPHMKRT